MRPMYKAFKECNKTRIQVLPGFAKKISVHLQTRTVKRINIRLFRYNLDFKTLNV